MTEAIDHELIEKLRARAESTGLVRRDPGTRNILKVPSILSCSYDPTSDAFRVVYDDLSVAEVRRDELAGTNDKRVAIWSVDEFRRGVGIVLEDGTVTSFSAEYPRYLRDPEYRKRADARGGHSGEDLGRRVANRIRALRTARGWSVADLARRSDIAPPNIHRVESGKHVPSTTTLVRLARALEVPLARLLKV